MWVVGMRGRAGRGSERRQAALEGCNAATLGGWVAAGRQWQGQLSRHVHTIATLPRPSPLSCSSGCCCCAAAAAALLRDTTAGSSPGTGTWGGPSCTSRHSTSMPVPKHSRCGSTAPCCCSASAAGARSICCCRSMAAQRSCRRAARPGRAAAAARHRAAPGSGPADLAAPATCPHPLGSMAGGAGG